MGSECLMGTVSILQDEKVLEDDGGQVSSKGSAALETRKEQSPQRCGSADRLPPGGAWLPSGQGRALLGVRVFLADNVSRCPCAWPPKERWG